MKLTLSKWTNDTLVRARSQYPTLEAFHVTHSTFAERFGYALWIKHLRDGDAPSFAEIGRAVDRTGPAVSAWRNSEEPPPDYRVHPPMAAYFDIDERWLIRDEGVAPEPELWTRWLRERRRRGAKQSRGVPATRPGDVQRKRA